MLPPSVYNIISNGMTVNKRNNYNLTYQFVLHVLDRHFGAK